MADNPQARGGYHNHFHNGIGDYDQQGHDGDFPLPHQDDPRLGATKEEIAEITRRENNGERLEDIRLDEPETIMG